MATHISFIQQTPCLRNLGNSGISLAAQTSNCLTCEKQKKMQQNKDTEQKNGDSFTAGKKIFKY